MAHIALAENMRGSTSNVAFRPETAAPCLFRNLADCAAFSSDRKSSIGLLSANIRTFIMHPLPAN